MGALVTGVQTCALPIFHAQDRFWQMDFYRHVGAGRTAEMFGEGQVETDTFLKALGWHNTAKKEFQAFNTDSRAILTESTEARGSATYKERVCKFVKRSVVRES